MERANIPSFKCTCILRPHVTVLCRYIVFPDFGQLEKIELNIDREIKKKNKNQFVKPTFV